MDNHHCCPKSYGCTSNTPTSHVIGETLSLDHAHTGFANTHLAVHKLKTRGALFKNPAFRYAAAIGAATGEVTAHVLE